MGKTLKESRVAKEERQEWKKREGKPKAHTGGMHNLVREAEAEELFTLEELELLAGPVEKE
jgi:hypothetical protein